MDDAPPQLSVLHVGEPVAIAQVAGADLRRAIRPSFAGQDHRALLTLIPDFAARGTPQLNLIRIPDGHVIFGPGRDGVVATADGTIVKETAHFATEFVRPTPDGVRAAAVPVDEDWVTVLDSAWHNHFHLLTLALPKLFLAARHRPEARVVVPAPRPGAAGARTILDQCLELGGWSDAVDRVPDGVYRPRTVSLVWTNYGQPAFLHFFAEAFGSFGQLAAAVPDDGADNSPRRVFVARPHNPRLPEDALAWIERLLTEFGFASVQLEDLDLVGQIRLFRNATHVVAAHGAGLSNIVFGQDDLRVLELNPDLDGRGFLRPWFLLLAAGRGLHYQYLDASPGELTPDRLREAFHRLLSA